LQIGNIVINNLRDISLQHNVINLRSVFLIDTI